MGGDPHHPDQRRQDRRALGGAGPAWHDAAAGLHPDAGGRARALTTSGLKKSPAPAGLFLFSNDAARTRALMASRRQFYVRLVSATGYSTEHYSNLPACRL